MSRMTQEEWENTPIYKQGLAMYEIGRAMKNRRTTVTKLAEVCFKHGVDPSFTFHSMESSQQNEQEVGK